MPLRRLKQYQFSRRRSSEPISAHLWAEIGSNNLLPAPRTHRRGEEDVRQGLRGLFQFVPKKLEQDFSVFTCVFARFAESCSNSVFRIGTGFSRVYQALWSFVPIVPVFNKSSIYKYMYRDPFLYSFFSRALGLKIIGTNGTFTRNA